MRLCMGTRVYRMSMYTHVGNYLPVQHDSRGGAWITSTQYPLGHDTDSDSGIQMILLSHHNRRQRSKHKESDDYELQSAIHS